MCEYRFWFQADEDVYVLQCIDCNTFQVRFGNTAFMFEPFAYKCFFDAVAGYYQKSVAGKSEDPIILPTNNNGMEILLQADELKKLHSLLDAADSEMRAVQMARMFLQ